MKRTTVLLTSRQNFAWHSMQEIIPMIEKLWLQSARKDSHEVRIFDVDQSKLSESLPWLLRAQNIVLTCFTPKLQQTATFLRKELSLDARFITYLHNQATIACWPYRAWGRDDLFRQDDVFVSSCRKDANTLRLTFNESSRVLVIPFTLSEEELKFPPAENLTAPPPFVFVGRLSPQKNLHTLLYAWSLLTKKIACRELPKLRIYGKEDDLGSPNMGLEFANYEHHLRELAERLGVAGLIEFRGHRPREELYQELSRQRHVFVAPSIHSDENFGMAAFRSLCMGNLAVLSRWGGHADFEAEFLGQVRLVDVLSSRLGPFIDPYSLAAELESALNTAKRNEPSLSARIPKHYDERTISARLFDLATEETRPAPPLTYSPLSNRILKSRSLFLAESPRQCKIFESYADPDAHSLLREYGMLGTQNLLPSSDQPLGLVPWAAISSNGIETEILVTDPHRGEFRFALESSESTPIWISDQQGGSVRISEDLAHQLLQSGFAFPSLH